MSLSFYQGGNAPSGLVLVADKALCLDADGNIVHADDPSAVSIFCGPGSTLTGERAEKLQAHYDAVAAAEKAKADKAAAEKAKAADESK